MRIAGLAAVFGVVVLCVLAGGAAEQVPTKEPPTRPAAAAKLIADLGSDDYRTRENAGKGLAALGEKALPEMRKALDATDDPEVSRRLSVLVRRIDHDRLVSPKRVSLAVKDKSVQSCLDEITKQTGYKIDFSTNGTETKHSFDLDNVPFWVAIDHVANAAGMTVYADSYDDASIRMYSQDTVNPHVAYAGPFRFLATQISSNKNVQLSGLSRRGFNNNGRAAESMNLSFQIQSEPKNPILGTTMTEVISATDDTGASLVPPKDPNNSRSHYYYGNNYRTHNAHANVQLVRLDKTATTIKTLKGKVGVIMLTATVPEVVVADPLKVKTKKLVGRTVEIDYDSLSEANGHYSLTLTLKKLGAADDGNPDYNWSNNLQQKMELYDDKGNKLRNNGATSINNNGAAVTMTVQFAPDEGGGGRMKRLGGPPPAPGAPAAKPGAPTKFVFNEWVSVTHEVTFEFKDIPLP